MARFVQERPELSFASGDKHHIVLLPQHHAELLSNRSAAPSPSQQKARPAAAAGGDASDPEDYLAGQRDSKRCSSREGSAGRERDRDRDKDGERGKERRAPGSEAPGSGGRDRREQQPAWQEDRQRYDAGPGARGSRGAAASPPQRGGAAAGALSPPFPGPPRPQDNRFSLFTPVGRAPAGGPPYLLSGPVAAQALGDYARNLHEALDHSRKLHEEAAYKALPLPLADR